jgi:hypothetical protein
MGRVASRLKELAREERKAVRRIGDYWTKPTTSQHDRQKLANLLLHLKSDGSFHAIHHWGNSIVNMPLLPQLLIHPSLIVDIEPIKGEQAFAKRYGVTPFQMFELIEKDFIIPNIYMYDSDKASGFVRYEDAAETLRPVLFSTKCRINSVRRKPFLSLIGKTKFAESVKEGEGLFRSALRKLGEDRRQRLCRDASLKGALVRTANNWAYVGVLGDASPEFELWMEQVRDHPPDEQSVEPILRDLEAAKLLLASPFTAAFGGTHIIHERRLAGLSRRFETVSFGDAEQLRKRSVFSREHAAFAEFLERLARHQWSPRHPETTPQVMNKVLNDQEFGEFLAFLIENRAERIEAEEILGRCREVAHDYKQFLTLWEEVALLNLRVEADMQRSAKLRHRRQLVAATAGGAVGGLIGTAASYAVPNLPAATPLIAVLMGATLTGAVQNFVGKLIESPTGELLGAGIRGTKTKLITDFEKLERISERTRMRH